MMALAALLAVLLACASAQTIFDDADQARLVEFVNGAAGASGNFGGNVRDARFGVSALLDLRAAVAKKAAVCALAAAQLGATTAPSGNDALADTLHAAVLASRLQCSDVKVGAAALAALKDALASNKLSELYAGIVAHAALKSAALVKQTPAFGAAIKAILALATADGTFKSSPASKDGSAFNAGLAFEALALGGASADERNAATKELAKLLGALKSENGALSFRDAADESVDSLANLRATAQVVVGLAELDAAGTRSSLLTDERLRKLALYFAQHKRVRSLAEAAALARGLASLAAERNARAPLCVVLGDASRTALALRVTDVLGRFAADAEVVVRALTADAGDAAALYVGAKAKASGAAGAQNTRYVLAFDDAAPPCGRYTARVDARPLGASAAVAAADVALPLVVHCVLDVRDTKLETFAAAASAGGGTLETSASVAYPERATAALALAAKQTLRVSFAVRDKAQPKRAVAVAQAFVRLVHDETARDVVFAARLLDAAAGSYQAEIYLDAKTIEAVGRQSGAWRVELLLGDLFLAEPLVWHVANAALTFKGGALPTPYQAHASLPLIAHKFRDPARRPPAVVSLAFALLCLAPLAALLLVALPRIGVSAALAPSGADAAAAVAFHALLAAVLVIYALYFFSLNMMQVLTYVGVLLAPLLLSGRALLSAVQARRLAAQ